MKRNGTPYRISFFALVISFASAQAQGVDYQRDVQPILVKHCYSCHGADKQKGGLRVDVKAAMFTGGDAGPALVAGKSNESEIIKRVRGDEPDDIMPPKGAPLSKEEIAILAKWIDGGAVWPESGDVKVGRRKSDHWSFQPVVKPALPKVKNAAWPRNAIDHFVLAKLEAQNLAPSPEADRYTLIRRVYLDLIGLLPTPEEADAFAKDASPDAYEKMVDRALASPHHGERWGRHWLDQARYADSNGYSVDSPRTMWPYRDWVIKAINADMPFDEFTIAQLAGDLLVKEQQASKSAIRNPQSEMDLLIATGFHRNTMINQEGGVKADQFRIEASYDRVATTSQVWLGLTLACAQCHTHKFDPITQKEYYQFFAFFNSTEDNNNIGPTVTISTPEGEKKIAEIKAEVDAALLDLVAVDKKKNAKAHAEQQKKVDAARKKLVAAQREVPAQMVMKELPTPRPSHVFIRGDFLRLGPEVTPDVPEVLPPLRRSEGAGELQASSPKPQAASLASRAIPNRLDLARWLVAPENPLTPRVTMNRVWLRYFPKGLVDTEEDFGSQGSRPTHPELLDWLASELIARKWSMKAMHKTIVMSATYRQASKNRSELAQVDAFNRLLARQSRLRVEAEIIRDVSLDASGLLSRKLGGPSVRPVQPPGVFAFTQNNHAWTVSTGEDRYRRGMYTFFFRSAPYPMLTTFDVPNLTQTCTARIRSNTPLQSLTLANDEAMFEMAQALALRVLGEAKTDKDRIERLFRLCLTRQPDAYEAGRLQSFLKLQRERFTKDTSAAKQVASTQKPKEISDSEAAAWTTTARAVMNLDEFITRE